MGYRIKTVSEMLGVPRNTLLAWERRYDLVTPDRQDNGYREYSEEDVARLREIKRLIDEGHKISEAISMAQGRPMPAMPEAAALPVSSGGPLPARLLAALLRYDRLEAERIARSMVGVSYREQIQQIYLPLLRMVGNGWAIDEIRIAQEHYISAFVRDQLVAMLLSLTYGPEQGPLAICAGYPEEQHDLGLLALSVLLALRGYRVLFLGANVPLPELLDVIRSQAPAMVCVAILMPRPEAEILAYARALSAAATGRVVLGGPGAVAPAVAGVEWHDSLEHLL